MQENEYVYKIKKKAIKNFYLLQKFDFYPFSDENGEQIIARKISLPLENSIVQNTKRIFEVIYRDATEEEKKQDFSEYKFDENGCVIMTPELEKEWTECQICFYVKGVGERQLFINASDYGQYFNSKVLDKCVPDIVNELLKKKLIYKAKVKNEK